MSGKNPFLGLGFGSPFTTFARLVSGGASVISDGLLMHLDAGDTNSYPGSGSTWTDLSGNGNNFTLSGVTYNSSTGSFTFGDNQGDYIARSTSDVIGGLTDITVEMWIKISTLQTQIPFISYNTSSSDNAFLIFKNGANSLIAFFGPSGGATVTFADNNWNTGNFIQFVIARLGSNIKYYINGTFIVETNSYPTGSFPTGGTLLFGQEQDSPGGGFSSSQDFVGDYANVLIYNKALTASEVLQNYNALKGRYS